MLSRMGLQYILSNKNGKLMGLKIGKLCLASFPLQVKATLTSMTYLLFKAKRFIPLHNKFPPKRLTSTQASLLQYQLLQMKSAEETWC